ncbi:Pyruvate/Phosphoenolpyruvate kinase-like domain-containing protein [Hyaloraphidium curvatum]|nr:Pyruvate/Phosphoenolpyruvate kinase-like domain-containing protein [Hyaloraphidium curvatum]
MRIPRAFPSPLFLPASNAKILASATRLPATGLPSSFVLDLEDSVAPALKQMARETARGVLEGARDGSWPARGVEMWVRINAVGSGEEVEDLKAILPVEGLAGIVIPKTETNADLDFVEGFVRALAPTSTKNRLLFHALVESPTSLLRLPFRHPRLASLSMAAEDYKAAANLPSPATSSLLHPRQAIVVAARAAGAVPLDMVFVNVKDTEGLEEECAGGRRMGFGGKWCIHPSQVAACNKVFGEKDMGEAGAPRFRYAEVQW